MEYTKGFKKLNLPEYFKFGIEIEANNVKTKGENSLYTGESAKYIKDKNWHMATKKEESLVAEGGAELVSPILHDTGVRIGEALFNKIYNPDLDIFIENLADFWKNKGLGKLSVDFRRNIIQNV